MTRKQLNNFILCWVLFTPYVTFGLFQSDLSPFYLLSLALVTRSLSQRFLIFYTYAIFVFIFLTTLALFLNNEIDFRLVKLFVSLVLIFLMYEYGKDLSTFGTSINWSMVSTLWLCAGVVALIEPKFFDALVYRVGHTAGRGSPGLTAEPSLYGLNSVFLYFIVNRFSKSLFPKVCVLASVVISGSAYAVAFLLVYLVIERHYKSVIFIILTFVSVLLYFEIDARLIQLATLLLTLDISALGDDESIFFRLSNFIYTIEVIRFGSSEVSSLNSGFTILFSVFQRIAILIVIVIFFSFSSFRTMLSNHISISGFIAIAVVLMIGPIAIPTFWILIGVIGASFSNNARKVPSSLP